MTSARPRHLLARYAPKALRSPLYRALHAAIGAQYHLELGDFAGRRILILGPASSAAWDLAALDTARYDTIVKMNNGLFVPFPLNGADSLRCDILFHSLTHDTRPVDRAALDAAGVRLLVHRTPTRSAFLATLRAEQQLGPSIRIIPQKVYAALSGDLGGASPTTGLVCASLFLQAPVAEVAIIGFSFFTTRYVAGYDDAVISDEAAAARVRAAGHHDPAREAVLLARLIEEARARGTTVTIGAAMRAAMDTMQG